jgi:hypothetical protein
VLSPDASLVQPVMEVLSPAERRKLDGSGEIPGLRLELAAIWAA